MTSPVPLPRSDARAGAAVDPGLRRHIPGIYDHMGMGLVVAGLVALLVAGTPAFHQPSTPLRWLAIFAPLG